MALGSNHVVKSDVGEFIPEMWSDDVIAAYKANLVVANLVSKINHKGKKGDTIHIPSPTRGQASRKQAQTQVTLQAAEVDEVMVYLDQHWEYSRIIEDIVEVQALPSMRRFYTDDAGYALARLVDTQIHELGAQLQGGNDYSAAVVGGDGETTYDGTNAAPLTDEGIRRMIQILDDQDVPLRERNIVVPPVEKRNLTGIPRFTEQAFVGETGGGNTIRNGLIGDLYGIPVYVSTNCATTTEGDRVGLLIQKDALVFAEQMAVRTQTQYKQEWLGDLFTADTIFGRAVLRPEGGIAFVVPA